MIRAVLLAAMCGFCVALMGCSPALNWRDVRFESGPLRALFPCKPDHGTRVVPLGAGEVSMTMLGCEADGVLFTLARVDAPDAAQAVSLMAHWRQATLASAHAQKVQETSFVLKKADPQLAPVRIQADGKGPDGAALSVHVVWVKAGPALYQAAVYEAVGRASVASTYFEGLSVE